MKKRINSFLLMLLCSVLWVFYINIIPKVLNTMTINKISFWMWLVTLLVLNILYAIFGGFKGFRKTSKLWIPLLGGIFLYYCVYYFLHSLIYVSLKDVSSYVFLLPVLLVVVSIVFSKGRGSKVNITAFTIAFIGSVVYLYDKIDVVNSKGILYLLGSLVLLCLYLFIIYNDVKKVSVSIYFSMVTCFIISIIYLVLYSSFSLPTLNNLLEYSLFGITVFALLFTYVSSYKRSSSIAIATRTYNLNVAYFVYAVFILNGSYMLKDLIAMSTIFAATLLTLFSKNK